MRPAFLISAALVLAAGCAGTGAQDPALPDPGALPTAGDLPSDDERRAAASEAMREAMSDVRYVSDADRGIRVDLEAGETLRVELETVPTAGYVWQIASAPDFLTLLGEATRPTDPAMQELEGFTGGNHFMRFDFVGHHAGVGEIVLVERRPWEQDEPPMDVFTLTVSVAQGE